jgi:hypothetical protein
MVICSEQTSKKNFNFIIRYINNILPTRKNLSKWGLSSKSDCSFCSSPETLLHVIAGCKTYLDEGRFTWRHDSVLNLLAPTLTAVQNSTLYADIPGFVNPSVITGDRLRPDLLLVTENRCLYILELTVGYEYNLQVNANRKRQKYLDLIKEQEADYDKVKFVNLSLCWGLPPLFRPTIHVQIKTTKTIHNDDIQFVYIYIRTNKTNSTNYKFT